MSSHDDLTDRRNAAKKSKEAADVELQQELAALHRMTRGQVESLRPRLECDDATFKSLIEAVEQATKANISIAEFTNRLKTLGTNVLAVARRASTLLPI
jgi:hypothetical protein